MADEPHTPGHKGWYTPRRLPHFDSANVYQAITFRLADSLPASFVAGLAGSDTATLRRTIATELDAGHGRCLLADPSNAILVERTLQHFDSRRYRLLAWVVMPNHVHVLVEPRTGQALASIIHSWKSWTAKEINRRCGTRGTVWQKDYFDRFIRDEQHYKATVDYIENNPVKAGLVAAAEDWRFGSAWVGFRGDE